MCGTYIGNVILIDAEHLCQTLVPKVYISRMHLIQDKLITVVTFLSQLSFKLIEVDLHILPFLVFLLVQMVLALSLSILDASLTWLSFLSNRVTFTTVAYLRWRSCIAPVPSCTTSAHSTTWFVATTVPISYAKISHLWNVLRRQKVMVIVISV